MFIIAMASRNKDVDRSFFSYRTLPDDQVSVYRERPNSWVLHTSQTTPAKAWSLVPSSSETICLTL